MSIKTIWVLLKETFAEWNADKASRLAAALAYYAIFSLAPLLIIAIAIVGAVFGEEAARGEIVGKIQGLVGKEGAQFIQTAIENASQPQTGTVASIISVVVILFGASGFFAQLQDALNTIWEVQPKPDQGLVNIIRSRFLSFTMVLGVGFLLLVSLLLSAALSAVVNYLSNLIPAISLGLQFFNFILSFAITTVLFGLIYKVLPDVKIAWSDVWIGAIITSLLFAIGRFLLGMYFGNSNIGSAYGAAGSLVIILAWIYYAAQILFFGAEFTQVYARRFGSQIVPTKNAVPMTNTARAEQGMAQNNQKRQTNKSKSTSPNSISRLFRRLTQPKRSKRQRRNRQP